MAPDTMMAEGATRVTVFGIGRLGLCMALVFEKHGLHVLGVDVNQDYVDAVNSKTLRSPEPLVEEYLKQSNALQATTSFAEGVAYSDLLFIMVPTPTAPGDRAYDTTILSNLLSKMNAARLENKHIIITCTVQPGYIAQVGRHLLRDCRNCTLSYNPEFIAQGAIIKGLLSPDFILIGEGSREIGDWLAGFYTKHSQIPPPVFRMSPESAEICKLANNCFVTMKVSYANLVADIADRTPNADKSEILRCIGADARIGSRLLLPGWGYGGPCWPRDNRALGSYSKSLGVEPLLFEASDRCNQLHAEYQAQKLLSSKAATHVFEDVAYKAKCPVPIIEESQALNVAAKVARAGKKVVIRDREIIVEEVRKQYGSLFEYEVVPLANDAQ